MISEDILPTIINQPIIDENHEASEISTKSSQKEARSLTLIAFIIGFFGLISYLVVPSAEMSYLLVVSIGLVVYGVLNSIKIRKEMKK